MTGLVTILAAGRALPQEPIPALDLDDPQKSVVVELRFADFSTVEVEDTDVVFGVPPALLGNPPLLGVKIFDLEGNVVEAFDAWHPLYSFTETEDGGEELEILDDASAPVTFPLRPNMATMEVTDLETEEILISVDLIPTIQRFCRDEPDDPVCQDIAQP